MSFHRPISRAVGVALTLVFALTVPIGSLVQAAPARSVTGRGIAASPGTAQSVTLSRHFTIARDRANPLLRTEPYRHTHIQIMPTYQWVAKHSHLVYSRGSSVHGKLGAARRFTNPLNLPAPACTLSTDPSRGDANPSVPGAGADGQLDSLDILAVGLSTTGSGSNLQASIRVVSLTSSAGQPAAAKGQTDNWLAQFDYGGTSYYLRAQYTSGDPATTTVYTYGTINTSSGVTTLHQPSGSTSGSMDLPHNTVNIDVPLGNVGSPPAGAELKNILFETDVQVGSPLYSADSRSAATPYDVGDSSAAGTCRVPSLPLRAPVPSSGSNKNLTYYGGPTVHHITNHLIFWLPQLGTVTGCTQPAAQSYQYEPSGYGSQSDQNYEDILAQYFKDNSGTSFYNLLNQYADQSTGAINNSVSFGGSWIDTCGYTSTASPGNPSVPGGTPANPVYDYDVQQEVLRAIKANSSWHDGLGNEYYVYLGFGVATCFNGTLSNPAPGCDISGAPPAFCAYHGDFQNSDGNPVIYSNMTDGALQTAFTCYQSPIDAMAPATNSSTIPWHYVNGHAVRDGAADAEISITSHEQFETVTDWSAETASTYAPPLGWYSSPNDAADGEIGDKCAYLYGNYNPADGANITLGMGHRYIVQLEYSNWANGCALGDNNVAAGSYGTATKTAEVLAGWNLLGVPTAGINSADSLAADMTRGGQLPAGTIRDVSTYNGGHWTVTVPGFNNDQVLSRTEGLFVLNDGANGTWTPSGTPYTSAPSIKFGAGWNLSAATWPNPGLMTDSIFNQIRAESHACTGSPFANDPCNSTVSEIAPYAPTYDRNGNVNGGAYIEWKPSGLDSGGKPEWPQGRFSPADHTTFLTGDQVPFTNGLWVQASEPVNWSPQGIECQATGTSVSKASWAAGKATVTFAKQPTAPPVGTQVIISGVSAPKYNGTVTITASTPSTITYNTADPGTHSLSNPGGVIDDGVCH